MGETYLPMHQHFQHEEVKVSAKKNGCMLSASKTRDLLPFLVAVLGILCGCASQASDTASVSRAGVAKVVQTFLHAAATKDSLLLSDSADEDVVANAVRSDALSIRHFEAAAAGATNESETIIYEDGADVVIDYELQSVKYQAIIRLHSRDGKLVVSSYGMPAKID